MANATGAKVGTGFARKVAQKGPATGAKVARAPCALADNNAHDVRDGFARKVAQRQDHLLFDRLKTPIGEAVLACDEDGRLHLIDWSDCEVRWRRLLATLYRDPILRPARDPHGLTSALRAYFDGDLKAIDTLPTIYAGTKFRNTVWKQLRTIKAGKTRCYGEIAAKLASSPRAVGGACGANPISIVIPCHRAVGANGSLTGYAGGIARKRWLLAHEGMIEK